MDRSGACMEILSLLLILSGVLYLDTIKLGCSHSDLRVVCKDIERKALLQFKDGLADPSGRLSSWVGKDCCKWRGVSCNNTNGRVTKLKLRNPHRDLGGEISPSLLHLKELYYLDLSMNNFGGIQIPEFFGSLEKLRYLNLSGASFVGKIPQSLGNLSRLLHLDLNNFLDQSTNSDLRWLSGLSSLKYLNMGGVVLSKATAYWLDIVNMLHSLEELHLSNCGLQNLPVSLPSINLTSLVVLDLSNNGFNSTIPHWLFNITSIASLDLNSNNLQGELPDDFARLNSLQQLDLSGNSYITGKLSSNLGKLCNLVTLKLSRNSINGEVSDFINSLSKCSNRSLERLDLGYNDLSGNLPISLGYLKNLRYLYLWKNSFRGSIPPSIGNLSRLEEFYLSNNQMNGIFPEGLGQLSKLVFLDLSENKWEGVISEVHFVNLSNLKELKLIKDSLNISLVFNISFDWIPPFKLNYLKIRSCQLGPQFPTWLRNQNEIMSLVISNARISDAIPDWFWLLDLKLDELDISINNISGRVPNFLNFLFPASVELNTNRFEGPVPLWSSNVTKLSLDNNMFSGPIPHNIGQAMPFLMDLYLSGNYLNGSIPMSIGNLSELISLVISNNNLSGKIPPIWDNITSLLILDMSHNSLSGTIPKSIGSLIILKFLILNNNNLSGELPPSLQNCSGLASLNLGDNKFSGALPAWIGEGMPSLSILSVRSNFFSGDIPSKLCSLSALHVLDLSHNNLSGLIPHCVGNFSGMKVEPPETERYEGSLEVVTKGRELEYICTLYLVNMIDLSNNSLSGELPGELANLILLGTLNLSMNHLTGNIPIHIGNLKRLETLDLSRNELSGLIPPSMTSLTFLNHLNLSYNNLSGEIPSTNQFQTLIDPSIYEGNPALCGHPLQTECPGNDGSSDQSLVEDGEDGVDFDNLWFFTSMAVGFILGFWGVCGTLIIKKSWRHVYFRFVDEKRVWLLAVISSNAPRLRRQF